MQPKYVWSSMILLVLGLAFVQGDPRPMARPTRPEEFKSAEDLRRYLDDMRNYYSLNGRARYGKRGYIPLYGSDVNDAWDGVRTILDVSQTSSQRAKLDKRRQDDNRLIRDHEFDRKHASRIDVPPCHMLDIVERRYADVQ